MYIEAMQDFSKKIPVQITKPLIPKEKCQLLLNTIGGNCYTEKR